MDRLGFRLAERDVIAIELAAPDLKRAGIILNMGNPKPRFRAEHLDAFSRQKMKMPRRIQLTPIRAVMSEGPTIRSRDPQQEKSTGRD